MSRLIDLDPQIQPEPEPMGYEFGYYTFDSLPALEVSNVETTQDISVKDTDASNNDLWNLPINNDILSKLQQEDVFCKNILNQTEKGNIIERQLYVVKDKLLKRYVIDRNNTYETTVVPRAITTQIL